MAKIGEVISRGVVADRPAFGVAGRLYHATDENLLYRDSGTAWDVVAISASGGGIPDLTEAIDDRVAALLVAGSNVTLTYNDGANTLTVDAAGSGAAADISIADSGNYYTGTNVETALQELGTAVAGAGTGDMLKSTYDPNNDGIIAVAQGGTNASTASGARTNLGLGTIATQDSSNVTITGGSVSGITDLAVADGGTGASSASSARTNLGLGTVATLDSDTDGTLAANSDSKVATQKAVKTYVDAHAVNSSADIRQLGITAAGGTAGSAISVTVQVKDGSGSNVSARHAVTCWLSTTSGGAPVATEAGLTWSDVTGYIIKEHVSNSSGLFGTASDGSLQIDVTDTDVETRYFNAEIGGRVYSAALVYAAPAVPTGGLVHHFDAQSLSSLWQDDSGTVAVASDGDPVGRWTNLTGGTNLIQATSGNKPTYKSAGLNSLPSVRFDGSNDYLRTAALATTSQPYTIWIVRNMTQQTNHTVLDKHDSSESASSAAVIDNGGNDAMYSGFTGQDGAWHTGNHAFCYVFNGASSAILMDNTSLATVNPGTGNLNFGTLMADAAIAVFKSGDIGEILIYSGAQDSTARAAVWAALQPKWGL